MVKCCIPICQCYISSSSFALTRGRSRFHRRFTKFIVLIIVETSFARIGISVMSSAKIDPFCLLYNSAEIQWLKCVSNKCDSVPSRQWRSKLESISLQENFSMVNFPPVSLLTNFHSLKYDVLAHAILRSCLNLMSETISMQKFFSLKFDGGKGVRLIHECVLYMGIYGSWK